MRNYHYLVKLAFLCLFVANQAFAQTHTPRYIVISEKIKGFYEYLPQGYPTSMANYPLILFIHGSGEVGQGTPESLPLVLRNGIPKLINEGSFPTSFVSGGQT